MQTTSDNKSIVRDFHRRVSEGDLAGATALVAEDLVNHAAIPEAQGRAGLADILGKLRTAFPDLRADVQDLIAEDDRVVIRFRMLGTHTGPFNMVRFQLPPTGRAVDVEHIHVYRLASGKIVEHWAGRDDGAWFRQLGLAPRPV